MDQIFDRLGNLLKSFVQDDDKDTFSTSGRTAFSDPDLQDAWEELDEFMKTGNDAGSGESVRGAGFEQPRAAKPAVPEALKKDYRVLHVPAGAPIDDVARSYKQLLRKHHPDRHATDPAALAEATEITKQLTSSFRRIRQYQEKGTL